MSIVKQIHFEDVGRKKLKKGISDMSRAVGSTMGPMGNTVLIESEAHTGGVTVTKDGVTVARALNPYDPVENLAAMLLREAATKTASAAGDGTTTAIVLAEAMITEADHHMTEHSNRTEITRYMTKMAEQHAEDLVKASTKMDKDMLYHVATVSANNDEDLGKLIGDAYTEVGEDGIVVANDSSTSKTYSTVTNGISFERGYLSNFHITDKEKNIVELVNPYILVTDLEVASFSSVAPLLELIVKEGRPVLIIGEVSMDFAATLNANISKGKIKGAHVLPPNFGYRREEMMMDIAAAVGAIYISEKTGSDWGLITHEFLGSADRVIIDEKSTSIIHNTEDKSEAAENRIADIRFQLKKDDSDESQDFLKERLAMLSGKVATIFVGGKTEIERKEKRDRVDDAVLATRAALEEGILPGGGIALMDQVLSSTGVDDEGDELTARFIMNQALQYPFNQILKNAGLNPDEIRDNHDIGYGIGYNPKTGQTGDMIKMGIIDPTKVTKHALLNATSVATTIIMTSAIITNVRDGAEL